MTCPPTVLAELNAQAAVASEIAIPAEPMSSSGLRPILSTRAMAMNVPMMLMIELEKLISSESAWLMPTDCHSDRRVVEDHVDADELLEHRQDDADPDDRQQSERGPAQVAAASAGARS